MFITDRGRPAHVLLSIEDYLRITGGHRADALAMPGLADIEFDPPRVNIARSVSSWIALASPALALSNRPSSPTIATIHIPKLTVEYASRDRSTF